MSARSAVGGSQIVFAPANRRRGACGRRRVISSTGRNTAIPSSVTNPCTLHGIPSTNARDAHPRATRREVRGRRRGVGRVDDPVHVRSSAVEPLLRVARPHRARAAVEARAPPPRVTRRSAATISNGGVGTRGRREQGVGRGLVLERDPLGPAPAVRGSSRNVVQRRERRREHERGAFGIEPRKRLEERGRRIAEEPLLGSDRCRDVDDRRQIPLDDISVRRGRQRSGAAPHTEHEAAFGTERAQRRDSTGRPRDRPAGEHDPPIAERVGQHRAHRLDARIHDASVTSRAPRAIGISASGLRARRARTRRSCRRASSPCPSDARVRRRIAARVRSRRARLHPASCTPRDPSPRPRRATFRAPRAPRASTAIARARSRSSPAPRPRARPTRRGRPCPTRPGGRAGNAAPGAGS